MTVRIHWPWVGRWTAGLIAGTLAIAIVSPWFVRSYVPRVWDDARAAVVLQSGHDYRWRAEGYATTRIGPHGMMGRSTMPTPGEGIITIALWGDSQAEGVCLDDDQKLWRRLRDGLAGNDANAKANMDVLPMAASGQDAADWVHQMAAVESSLGVDAHVILLSDVMDLWPLMDSGDATDPDATMETSRDGWLNLVPDFVIDAGRRLLIDPATSRIRRPRFRPGPIAKEKLATDEPVVAPEDFPAASAANLDVESVFSRLRDSTTVPILIIAAPNRPLVLGDEIRAGDPDPALGESLAASAVAAGIGWLDARPALVDVARIRRNGANLGDASVIGPGFPHGFDHGRIGSGHLNETGTRVIADQAVRWIRQNDWLRRSDTR